MNTPFRQIHLDFHTSPEIPDIGTAFDPEQFVQTLKDARVNSINVFAKGHHGMCYFPSEVGTVHPGLDFDLLGAIIQVCHREGIRVPVYIPTGWEEDAAKNEDWLEVSMEGILGGKKPFETGFYRWKKLCHNKKSYIDYILSLTDELIEKYDIDGFWYDIVFQEDCVCRDCLASMASEGLDPENKEDVKKNGFLVIERFMKHIRGHLEKKLPGKPVYFNMHIDPDGGYDPDFSIRRKNYFQTHIEIESLPSGEWGYNHFPLYVNYLNTFAKETVGMNGKFHKSWGDFGTLKNREALEYECFRMTANGCKCSIGDQMHPSGILDPAVYKRVGEVYSHIEALEPWLEGSTKVREVAVLMANRPLETEYSSDEGVMRMLLELKVPFDFIDFDHDFSNYRVVILPDRVSLSEKQADKLKQYIAGGGHIIATALSGTRNDTGENGEPSFLLPLGIQSARINEYEPSFTKFEEQEIPGVDPFTYAFYQRGLIINAAPSVEQFGRIYGSYFNRSWNHFCSHCQTPVNTKEDLQSPAIITTTNTAYCAYPIFSDYMENGVKLYRDIFSFMLKHLITVPFIDGDFPPGLEATLWEQEAKNRMQLHLLYYLPQRRSKNIDIVEEKPCLRNMEVRVRTEEKPKAISSVPDEAEISFSWDDSNGVVIFHVDEMRGYRVLSIRF